MARSDIFLKFLGVLEANSKEETLALITDDLEWVFKPSSLGIPPVRKSGMDEVLKQLSDMRSFKFTTHKVHETTDGVFIYETHSDGISETGSTWHNEYVFTVHLTPEGDKIANIVEFMDSKALADFVAGEKAKAGKGAA